MFALSSSPCSSSVESLGSSLSTKNSLQDNSILPFKGPSSSEALSQYLDHSVGTISSTRKHSRYYFPDGNVIFLVEETLYKVHRYFFQRDSSIFASIFSDSVGRGSSDDDPISLVKVTVKDFDRFLSILYPADFRKRTVTTADEWGSVLDLAAEWNFQSIKHLAIDHIAQADAPVDKIVLGRKHNMVEWLGEAYEAVCKRKDPLTQQEGVRLGVEDVIRISAVRQIYGLTTPRYDPMLLSGDLPKIFAFDTPSSACSMGTSDSTGSPEAGLTKKQTMARRREAIVRQREEERERAEREQRLAIFI